jgi:NADH:ubiquinone reductase (H+-translocating)
MAKRARPSHHVDGILVVGGGYAGLHAAHAAAGRSVAVTVLDPTGRHDFVTRLAAVAGRAEPASAAARALTSFGHEVIVGTATGLADGEVDLADGTSCIAGAVVFCAGAAETRPGIDGIEHALPLRTSDHALAIRDRLDRQRGVTIIGGGATGVQLAGAIAASGAASHVRLVEMGPRLLSTMHEDSSAGATRILEDRGVDVLVSASVDRISVDGLVVDGVEFDGLTIWAGGFAPRTDGLGVALNGTGRIVVDEYLRVAEMTRTFAAGDVAAHVDGSGAELPMSAQVAVQAGEAAGANAARVVNGGESERVSLSHQGWVLDLSGHRGIAEFGDISLAGPFADLIPPFLHDAIDLKTVLGMGGWNPFPSFGSILGRPPAQ